VAEKKIPQPTFLNGLGNFYFNIKYDDCYPFIFTNIKGPILVKEEDMDTYIRNHKDDFIGQAEESLPIKSCRRLFELFGIDTDWLDR
jgi:hypothetical protein